MKLINSIQGSAIIKFRLDDIAPEGGFLIRDVIGLVGEAYQFGVKPDLPANVPPAVIPVFQFQSGAFGPDAGHVPIVQILMFQTGVVITSTSTDAANAIMDDYLRRLTENMGFRFPEANMPRTYQSHIVVEFDKGIETYIRAIERIENTINRRIQRPNLPFKVKRLAFGSGDPILPQQAMFSLDAFINADFSLERRAGASYEENRYFCTAPTTTGALVQTLQEIEAAIAQG